VRYIHRTGRAESDCIQVAAGGLAAVA